VRELLLLQRVAQRINSVLDLEPLLEQIVDDVAVTFGYSRSGILLIDEVAGELVIAAVRGWTVNYHVKGDRFKIGRYGMVGHVASTGETLYAPDVRKSPYYRVSEESTRSEIDIPLRAHGRVIGVFNAQSNRSNGFPASRRQLLEALAGHIGTAIENARLFGREREQKERMARELARARQIQTSLLPGRDLAIPGFEITSVCLPCNEVGGDWFDYIPLRDGRVALVLGDVSGKGMGAALLLSSARSIVRMCAEQGASPGDVLTQANRMMLRDFPEADFVTAIFAVLDPGGRRVVFASAGHPWPLFESSTTEFLETDAGFPLGLFESRFAERSVDMPPGSALVLYSDGIIEAANPTGEVYGEERLCGHIAKGSFSVDSLVGDVRAFVGGRAASDDITVVIVRARGEAAAAMPVRLSPG